MEKTKTIEATEEMLEAGGKVLEDMFDSGPGMAREVAREVYAAMVRVKPASSGKIA